MFQSFWTVLLDLCNKSLLFLYPVLWAGLGLKTMLFLTASNGVSESRWLFSFLYILVSGLDPSRQMMLLFTSCLCTVFKPCPCWYPSSCSEIAHVQLTRIQWAILLMHTERKFQLCAGSGGLTGLKRSKTVLLPLLLDSQDRTGGKQSSYWVQWPAAAGNRIR